MKHLLPFGEVKPIIFNGKLISITLKLNVKGHMCKVITFKDSMLMLPLSLSQLSKSFKIESPKGSFPFLLNDLNYNGQFPDFKFFTSLTLIEYNKFKNEFMNVNKIWDFKIEAIKYCKLDCLSLYQVMSKFSNLVYKEFKVDPFSVLTLPSLAMRIWKTFYMPKDTVYQLHGLPELNIRKSYTGGAVDVYIPTFTSTNESDMLYVCDVNGLYPNEMKNLMPIGEPVAFLGDIRKIDSEAFGFFYCKIKSPEYLEHPILQRSIKVDNKKSTIAGLGSWEGWIFSAEMDNAMKYGYTFEILRGYEFKKGNIFSTYVDKMYALRMQYPKGDAMNLIAKLLMNSLYGKFGMNNIITKVKIINNKEELNKYLEKYNSNILDIVYLDNYVVLTYITYEFIPNGDHNYLPSFEFNYGMDVNVAIASAITSYARIYMSSIKNNPLFKLFYTDTDSGVVDKPLPSEMVGPELGKFKLEHKINKAVFLAPKVYGFIDDTNTEIIKVKGLTKNTINKITLLDLEELLMKDSIKQFSQEKGFKNIYESNILRKELIYTLKSTSNKRNPIYLNNKFIGTKPFNYNEIE